jgi:hypothetical protein
LLSLPSGERWGEGEKGISDKYNFLFRLNETMTIAGKGIMFYVYHYTKVENIEDILTDGLSPKSRFQNLQSEIRQNAIYGWLAPSHETMGYEDDRDYVCIRLNVMPERCLVADMDLISAAYVNWVGPAKQPQNRELAEKLVNVYDSTAIPISQYESGIFRSPEVLIQGHVEPGDINMCLPSDYEIFSHNKEIYKRRLKERLHSLADIKKERLPISKLIRLLIRRLMISLIAVHDDTSGYLATYLIEDTGEYFTISFGRNLPSFLMKYIDSENNKNSSE